MLSTSNDMLDRMPGRAAAIGSLAALVLASACSDSTSSNRSASQIAFTSGLTSASALIIPVTTGGHTLDLTLATLTISRVELKPTKSNVCEIDDESGDDDLAPAADIGGGSLSDDSRDADDDDDCPDLKAGPVSVDLPLSGGIATLPANAIPAGTFREIELKLASVRLVGTFDGKPFDVTVPVNTRGEFEFSTPLVVADGTPTSVTINVPVGGWFINSTGALIDPSTISSNATLLARVRTNIIASFRAFEDEDHDGHDDHGGNRGPG
jgi:hypothetical protein